MRHRMDRRSVLLAAPTLVALRRAETPFDTIERRVGGRLGVFAVDTGTGRTLAHRADERFAMCSSFKALLAARVLQGVDDGSEHAGAELSYGRGDLLANSPVSQARLGTGLTVTEACEAIVTQSDNTAANLLLARVGGPAGLTRWLRGLGDSTTRLDRTEPSLNSALPGDLRDTTTPAAVVQTWRRLLLGSALQPSSRAKLDGWLHACRTGQHRLRAGLPASWSTGDKTGTSGGDAGTWNDIALTRPPGRAPILVAALLTRSPAPQAAAEGALAEVGAITARTFARG